MSLEPYVYEVAEVIRVVDGDTIDCRLALGFGLTAAFRFRLANVDTPETYGPLRVEAGKAATAFTDAWLGQRQDRLRARTFKGSRATVGLGDGAFGRWLADIWCWPTGEHLADALVAAGHVAK